MWANALDLFTQKRVIQFAKQFRQRSAQFPILRDFEAAGFTKEQVQRTVKNKQLVEVYVTLTNGATAKGFKAAEP